MKFLFLLLTTFHYETIFLKIYYNQNNMSQIKWSEYEVQLSSIKPDIKESHKNVKQCHSIL